MILFAKFCALLSILYLVKAFLYPIFKPVSARQKKRTRKYMKEKQANALKQKIYLTKKKFASQYIRNLMSSAEQLRYKKMIERLDLPIKAEEIRVNQMIYVGIAISITIIMFTANRLLGCISASFIFLGWLYPVSELEKKIEQKNKNISEDFPAFYSMVYYQYSKSVNIFLADVIKDYIPNTNIDMAEELGVMLDNMDYGEEYALKQFKKRVPIHYIVKFCDIMETRLRGYDNTSQMTYLKNELDEYRIRFLEDELERREKSNTRVQLILIVVLVIYIVMYYLFTILDALILFS